MKETIIEEKKTSKSYSNNWKVFNFKV